MSEPPIESDELDKYDPAVLTKAQRKAIISGQLTGQEQAEVEERAREFETRFEELIVDLALLEYSNVHPQHIYFGSAIDTDLPLDTLLGDTHLMSDGFHTDFGALLGRMYEVIFLPRDLYPADVVYGLLVGICGEELEEHDTGRMESILEDVEAELTKRWALTDYHRPFDYSHRDSIDIKKVITDAGFEKDYDSLSWILQILVNSGAKREIHYDTNAHQTDSYPNLGETDQDEYKKAMQWLKDNTPVDIVPSVQEYIMQDAKEVNNRSWRGLDAKEGLDILVREETISKGTFKSAIEADQPSQSTALLNSYSDVSDSKMDLRTNFPLYRRSQDNEYEITNYGKLVHTCLHADSEINLLFYGALRRNGLLWHALGQHKEIERHDTFPELRVIQLAADTIRDYRNSAQYHLQPVS